jgi:hypothetical protein
VVLVICALLGLLSLVEPVADIVEEGSPLFHLLRHCRHACLAGFV